MAELIPHDEPDWWTWVDLDGDGVPDIRVRLGSAEDGRLHVEAVLVEGTPVSASHLRGVPLGRIEAHANATLHPDAADRMATNAKIPAHLFDLSGRGRSDEFYAEVAAVYASLVSRTHQPVAVIAETNNVARVTAHRWIKQARDRGLLPPGRPGKAG
jgi:hypothetical protein